MIETFKGKTVLITGHTGFKGSWLSVWMISLGAKVVGVSLDVPTIPSNYFINLSCTRTRICTYVCVMHT